MFGLLGKRAGLRLSMTDLRHHVLLLGPTGGGKTTLMEHIVIDAVADGGSGALVCDPKDGSLCRHVVERVPWSERDRIVYLDPSSDLAPAINPLHCPDPGQRNLVVSSIVSIFANLFAQHWQHKQERWLRVALLTLLQHEGTTLCDVGPLLSDSKVRARFTEGLTSPRLLASWQEWESMGASGRAEAMGPLTSKIEGILLHDVAHRVLGQPEPTVPLAEAIDARAIVLVDLSKGKLGDDTSSLLGSLLVAQCWQAVLRRAPIPEPERQPFMMCLDEAHTFTRSFSTLQDALADSRSLGVAWVLACQHSGQLSREMRDSVVANARTKVIFDGPDVGLIDIDPRPQLRKYEAIYQPRHGPARVIRTRPRSRKLHDGQVLSRWSQERYGMPKSHVDAQLARMAGR